MGCCTSKNFRFFYFILFLVITCTGVSFFTTQFILRGDSWKHDTPHGHQWLHKELELSAIEIEKFDAFEDIYKQKREVQLKEFQLRMARLADLLRHTNSYTIEVEQSVHHLHEVHAKLQRLSIEHYYEMLSVLPDGKQEKLRNLAVEALSQPE